MDSNNSRDQAPDKAGDEVKVIPRSYWQSKYYSDESIRYAENFVSRLSLLARQLADKNSRSLYLQIGSHGWITPYDDAFYPYWQNFANALENYRHEICIFAISNTQLPKKVLDILIVSLQSKNIKKLKLNMNDFGREGIIFVSDILSTCPLLQRVKSENNEINCLYAATRLSQALRSHPCLKELCIHQCGLGNENEILSVVLNGAKNIESVNLSNNNIGPQGYISISEVLAENTRMESLELSDNILMDDDAACLSQALRKNTNLKSLVLNGYETSSVGIEKLRESLFDESSLSTIYNSNHTCVLRVLTGRWRFIKLLTMNREATTNESRIKKMFFALRGVKNGMLNLKYLDDIKLEMMPHIFEFLQKDPDNSKRLSNIFEGLHWKMPLLFASGEI